MPPAGNGGRRRRTGRRRGGRRRPVAGSTGHSGDRWIIFAQMVLGATLIVFGALLGVLFPSAETLATAIIGAGAALLPAGAAAAASARIGTVRRGRNA